MSALEVPAFLIGLASLFNSCIDAFAYFKLAQRADREIEIVLLKLDIEKARLLIWGDHVGIVSARHRNQQLLDESLVELIKQILKSIEKILTDSEKLRTRYGAQTLESRLDKAIDYISTKSLDAYRTSAGRFWVRNAARLATATQRSTVAKTKWAVYEREKFQALVNDLAHFVDRLFELTKVDPGIQHQIIIQDIDSILDVSQLTLIEEATEDSYTTYAKAAASVRASTEAGTVDRRTVEEHLRDTLGTLEPVPTTASSTSDLDSFWKEVQTWFSHYFVLTNKCRKMNTQDPCDVRLLGSQVTGCRDFETPAWDISSRNQRSGRTLSQLIEKLIGIRKKIKEIDQGDILGNLMKMPQSELTDEQQALIKAELPLIDLIIYCAPCTCLVHTASNIGRQLSSPFLNVIVRPDDRLVSSCCVSADRALGLRSLLEHLRTWEATKQYRTYSESHHTDYLDYLWLERRIDHLDHEIPYESSHESRFDSKILILGEVDFISSLVQKAPGPRIPKALDIWHHNSYPNQCTLFARFIEHQPFTITPQPNVPIQNIPIVLPQVQREAIEIMAPISPLSSSSKRRRVENGSVSARSVGEGSEGEDERMEDRDSSSRKSYRT